jgi:predicted nucleic acid-binding protein
MKNAHKRRIRLFLDANVLVSAAWKDGSKVCRIWQIAGVELLTSNFVVAECLRNLPRKEQQSRFVELLLALRVLNFEKLPRLESPPPLPEKDQHVLAAAVLARADFLVTGDRKHFGAWYGGSVCGIRVEPPGRFPLVLEQD